MGVNPNRVRRTLLPTFEESLARWSEFVPLPAGGAVWLLLPRRRLIPDLLLELIAMEATGARPTDLKLIVAETIPPEGSVEALLHPPPADAVRAALIRLASERPTRQTVAQAIVEETHRLRRIWRMSRLLLEGMESGRDNADARGITPHLAELLPEDRAFLAVFERTRLEVLRAYDREAWAEGYLTLTQFLLGPFRDRYLPVVAARRSAPPGDPGRAALFQVLHHTLPRLAELGAPVAPHISEAIHRALGRDGTSLFQGRFAPIVEAVLDPKAEAALDRWGQTASTVWELRRRRGIPAAAVPLQAVLILGNPAAADLARAEKEVWGRLLGTSRITVASPEQPWTGRRVEARLNSDAIRQAYPSYHRRVLSVLGQIDPRRLREALRNQSLAVAIEGQPPMKITPTMVDLTEALPEGFIEVAWRWGELYLEFPAGTQGIGAPGSPLPLNAARVARHVRHRLSRTPRSEGTLSKLFVSTDEPFRSELLRSAAPLARELGLASVLITDSSHLFSAPETTRGRFARGVPFRVWIPGSRPSVRPRKSRAPRPPEEALPTAAVPEASPGDPDYLSEDEANRSEGIRALLSELDGVVGRPWLGPAKLGAAWDQGLRTPSAIGRADPILLAALPGFGPVLTRELVRRIAPDRPVPEFPQPPAPRAPIERPPPSEPTSAPSERTPAVSQREEPPVPREPEEARRVAVPPAPLPTEVVPVRAGLPERMPHSDLGAPTPPPTSTPAPTSTPNPLPIPSPTPPAAPPDPPGAAVAVGPPPSPTGGVEVRVGPDREPSWELFLAALDAGIPGLWIGRLYPRSLTISAAGADARFLWLSTSVRPNSVAPSDLDGLLAHVQTEVRDGSVRTVILEEIEYLAALNGTPSVRAFLARLDDLARSEHVRILVPLVADLMGGDTGPLQNFSDPPPLDSP
ncbi:MAG: DUF835 domain-containing protein [Thermoplasmata archaeon]